MEFFNFLADCLKKVSYCCRFSNENSLQDKYIRKTNCVHALLKSKTFDVLKLI